MTGASSAATARELKTINPATEEIINRYEIMTKEQIDDKVKKARSTFQRTLTSLNVFSAPGVKVSEHTSSTSCKFYPIIVISIPWQHT